MIVEKNTSPFVGLKCSLISVLDIGKSIDCLGWEVGFELILS
jgi:hypothetical protein